MLLVPTNLPHHVSGGRATISAMTAIAMSAGAAARYGIALRQVSPGRDSARARPNALTASVIVTTNLKRKRGVSAAAAISGLGPSSAKKTAAARPIPRPTAPHHTDESDSAGGRVSAAKALMSSFVSILAYLLLVGITHEQVTYACLKPYSSGPDGSSTTSFLIRLFPGEYGTKRTPERSSMLGTCFTFFRLGRSRRRRKSRFRRRSRFHRGRGGRRLPRWSSSRPIPTSRQAVRLSYLAQVVRT